MPRFDRATAARCLGLWLLVASAYALTSPGRLDMIDAQFKFETTASLLAHGDTRLRDPHLLRLTAGAAGTANAAGAAGGDAPVYAPYPLGAPLAGAPAAALARGVAPGNRDLQQFAWSLTSAWLGALIAPVLLLAWRRLGVAPRASLGAALAVAFGTLLWPLAASSFDQAQHALFLLVAVLLADAAAERDAAGRPAVAPALLAGVAAGVVVHYQPAYGILLAPLALAAAPSRARWSAPAAWRVPAAIVAGFVPFAAALLAYNAYRFGSVWTLAPPDPGVPLFGNPLAGMAVLLASPGKSVLLYSPLLLVALRGFRRMGRRRPRLAALAASIAGVHLLFVSSLTFAAGDWCWGPRYLVTTLPLVALALPFGWEGGGGSWRRSWRPLARVLLVLSVAVQVLGLSLDHQRFFFERGLLPHFWLRGPSFYFANSPLAARVGELAADDVPPSFPYFSSAPAPLLTYAPFGPPARLLPGGHAWVRQFAVFFWPRPWPLWMTRLAPQDRFFPPWAGLLGFTLGGALGAALLLGTRPRGVPG